MNASIDRQLEIAGNRNKYQYIILVIAFLFWLIMDIVSISLPYLEKTSVISLKDPNNSTQNISVSLNYSTCNKNYTIVEQSHHSWVIEFDIECDQFLTGMIGSITFTGVLVGSLIFQFLVDYLGRKKTIIYNGILFSVFMLMFNFISNITMAYILSFLVMIFAYITLLSIFMLSTEITAIELRSVFGAIINSAFSFSGIMFIVLYKYFDNWRLDFNVAFLLSCFVTFLFIKYGLESPRFYYACNNQAALKSNMLEIAKYNNREVIYRETMCKLENEYNQSISEMANNTEIVSPDITSYEESNTLKANSLPIASNLNNKNELKILSKSANSSPSNRKATNKSNNSNIIVKTSNKLINNNSILDYPIFQLVLNKKLRPIFLINCYLWFSTSGIYYGLSIYLKNLPGDIYVNGIFIYVFEVFSYVISGWIINTKTFGRKYSMIMFESISLIGYTIMIVFDLTGYTRTMLSFCSRFAISGVYNIIYTYSMEIYPTVVRAKGFGFNSICARLGGIFFPLLLEIMGNDIIILFVIVNFFAMILVFYLPETLGKPLLDNLEDN